MVVRSLIEYLNAHNVIMIKYANNVRYLLERTALNVKLLKLARLA